MSARRQGADSRDDSEFAPGVADTNSRGRSRDPNGVDRIYRKAMFYSTVEDRGCAFSANANMYVAKLFIKHR